MPLQPAHKSTSTGIIAIERILPFNNTVIVSIDRMSMFATHNSRFIQLCRRICPSQWMALALLLLYATGQTAFAQANGSADRQAYIAYADKILAAAREKHQASPTNSEATWHFASACFERAEFAANDTERATLAVEGINAMRSLLVREPDSAPAHYYLGMNLGQLARTKTLGALRLVGQMEDEFQAARKLDEKFSHAGPDRNLGQLYFQAPGWPASIGSRSKARKHMERAVELAPGYPENQLNLIEAYVKWRDSKEAKRQLKSLDLFWPDARTNLVGQAWAPSWADWEKRRQKLLDKLSSGSDDD